MELATIAGMLDEHEDQETLWSELVPSFNPVELNKEEGWFDLEARHGRFRFSYNQSQTRWVFKNTRVRP